MIADLYVQDFTRFLQIWQWLIQKTSVPAALQNMGPPQDQIPIGLV